MNISESNRLEVGQRVRLKANHDVEGEVGAVDAEDGVAYFVMWDDGKGQDRGLSRPATVESPMTVEAI